MAGEFVRAADALDQSATYQYHEKLLVQETFKNGLSFYFEYAGQGLEARCTRTWGDEGLYNRKLVYDLDTRRTLVADSLHKKCVIEHLTHRSRHLVLLPQCQDRTSKGFHFRWAASFEVLQH
jgi:hypothetical protein